MGLMVYWAIEPPPFDRLERAIALLTAVLANAHRDSRKGKAFGLEDFLPDYWQDPEQETEQDGMAPEHVMGVMEGFMRAQERREQMRGRATERSFRD